MSSLKINVSDLSSNITNYKTEKGKFVSNYNKIYNTLVNVDGIWKDKNTNIFKLRLIMNNVKIKKYIAYLDSLYSLLSTFKSGINSVSYSYIKKNDCEIKINFSSINECLLEISNAQWYISDAVNKICSITYPVPDFTEFELVKYVNLELQKINNKLSSIYNFISEFSSSISNQYNTLCEERKKIEDVKLNFKLFKFTPTIQNFSIDKSENKEIT